jgi:glycerol-3-phosphate dehydrogenase
MKTTVETDIAIIGGGIAGLWLLNRVRQLGYSAILLETNTLGSGQTGKSQGIIHGGLKYSLQGSMTSATEAIATMPTVWEDCLAGRGEIDLSHVALLSKNQYLWSTGSLTSKLAGFFAGLTLKSNIKEIKKESFPEIFQNPQFKGQVYSLEEIVVDVNSLMLELVKSNREIIFKMDAMREDQLQFDQNGRLTALQIELVPLEPLRIEAQKYIFTAGVGNENLLKPLHNKGINMQRRPLHMVLAKTDFSYPLYGHCLGLSTVPRITITTHKAYDGKTVWYMGGQLAEDGIKKNSQEQIKAASQELQTLFPWLDFSNTEFASFMIDRAEPLQSDGKRPDSCYFKEVENVIAAWPTKLAFAPQLANDIIAHLQKSNFKSAPSDIRPLRAWPIPPFAAPVWDELL